MRWNKKTGYAWIKHQLLTSKNPDVLEKCISKFGDLEKNRRVMSDQLYNLILQKQKEIPILKKKHLTKGSRFHYDKSLSMQQHVKLYFGLNYRTYHKLIKQGCSLCGCKKNIHLHHIVPKSEGGTNDLSNLQPLCVNCHQKQHTHNITRE